MLISTNQRRRRPHSCPPPPRPPPHDVATSRVWPTLLLAAQQQACVSLRGPTAVQRCIETCGFPTHAHSCAQCEVLQLPTCLHTPKSRFQNAYGPHCTSVFHMETFWRSNQRRKHMKVAGIRRQIGHLRSSMLQQPSARCTSQRQEATFGSSLARHPALLTRYRHFQAFITKPAHALEQAA